MNKINKMSSGKALAVCACQRSIQSNVSIASWLINGSEQKFSSFLACSWTPCVRKWRGADRRDAIQNKGNLFAWSNDIRSTTG